MHREDKLQTSARIQRCRNNKGAEMKESWWVLVLLGVAWPQALLAKERTLSQHQRHLAWQAKQEQIRLDPEQSRVEEVNRYFNRAIRYTDDKSYWHEDDYWATPGETIGHGHGDCEDYAIAKYFSLRQLNVAQDKLKLFYVEARPGGSSGTIALEHVVLAYYPAPAEEPLILDNLVSTLYRASQRPDLTPLFSFDTEGIRVGTQHLSTDQLPPWHRVLTRIQSQRD